MKLRPPLFPSEWSTIPIAFSNLTLANTLPVGQSFLWHRRVIPNAGPAEPQEEYSRALSRPDRVVCLRQSHSHLYYAAIYPDGSRPSPDHATADWLKDYFQLHPHLNLDTLYADWRARDPGLFGKVHLDGRAVGVRLLRQDPWECLVAFITSTNNHIQRISSLMHKLCRAYARPVLELEAVDDPINYYLFPAPDELPDQIESELRELGFGYRAGFLESSLASLREKFGREAGRIEAGLNAWRGQEVSHVRDSLLELKGVGRKVADCVMLMCLDQPSLIPIDTHVAAIAARHPSFPSRLRNKPMSKQLYEETQEFLLKQWGPMGGWAQAVMFAADLPVKAPTTPIKNGVAPFASTPPTPRTPATDPVGLSSRPSPGTPSKRRSLHTAEFSVKRTRSATKLAIETEVAKTIEVACPAIDIPVKEEEKRDM